MRIGVFGSCVSRDSLELMPLSERDLLFYVARQSISRLGVSSSGQDLDLQRLASAFQRRIVQGDANASIISTLHQYADKLDVLLCDLVDERLGLIQTGPTAALTHSAELDAANALGPPSATSIIPFGSDEHFSTFRLGAKRLLRLADRLGLLNRMIMLRVPFASHFDQTSSTHSATHFEPYAQRMNATYERYYDLLDALGFPILELPPSLARIDPAHRWGPAAFHYAPPLYETVCAALRFRVRTRSTARPEIQWPRTPIGSIEWMIVPPDSPSRFDVRLRSHNPTDVTQRAIFCVEGSAITDSALLDNGLRISDHPLIGQYRYLSVLPGDNETSLCIDLAGGKAAMVGFGRWENTDPAVRLSHNVIGSALCPPK